MSKEVAEKVEHTLGPLSELASKKRMERAAPVMLAALKFVKEFFRKMEDSDLPGDPLIEMRRKYHAPVHAKAIAEAEK